MDYYTTDGYFADSAKTDSYGGGDYSNSSQAVNSVIVIDDGKQIEFGEIKEAAMYITASGMLPYERVRQMLIDRQPVINGMQVFYS